MNEFVKNVDKGSDSRSDIVNCPSYTLLIGGVAAIQSWLRFSQLHDANQKCKGWKIETWNQVFETQDRKGFIAKSNHVFTPDGLLDSMYVEEARRIVFVNYEHGGYCFSDGKYIISHVECEQAEFFLEDNNFATMSGLFALRKKLGTTDETIRVLPAGSFELIDLDITSNDDRQKISFCKMEFELDDNHFISSGYLPDNANVRVDRYDSPVPTELQVELFDGSLDFNEIYPVQQEEVLVKSSIGTVNGTFSNNPSKKKTDCVAMLVGGTGRYNRDGLTLSGLNIGYGRFMDALAYAGLPTIRYDRRVSLGSKEILTTSQIYQQAQAILDYTVDTKSDQCVVVGHSYGTLIAAQLAQNNNVALLVLIAGPAEPIPNVIDWQRKRARENIPDAKLREAYFQKAEEFDEKLKNANLDELTHTERSSVAFFRSVADQTVFDFLDEVKCPILVLHGEDDEQVPSSHAHSISKWLENKNKAVRCEILPNVGHLLSPQGNSSPSKKDFKDFDRKLINVILDTLS